MPGPDGSRIGISRQRKLVDVDYGHYDGANENTTDKSVTAYQSAADRHIKMKSIRAPLIGL